MILIIRPSLEENQFAIMLYNKLIMKLDENSKIKLGIL